MFDMADRGWRGLSSLCLQQAAQSGHKKAFQRPANPCFHRIGLVPVSKKPSATLSILRQVGSYSVSIRSELALAGPRGFNLRFDPTFSQSKNFATKVFLRRALEKLGSELV